MKGLIEILESVFFLALSIRVLGLIAAGHAVMRARTAPAASAWAISLIAYPYIALPFYLVFGRNKFNGYVRHIQSLKQKLGFARQSAKQDVYAEHVHDFPKHLALLEELTHLPFTDNNHVELLIDGDDTFKSIFHAIELAETYILVEFYIVRDDSLGKTLQTKLIHAAKSGVKVHFLYDEIGSYALPKQYLDTLKQAGVEVIGFQSTRGSHNRFQVNFRNHRKIVIVDGIIAFVGGLNVGDEYLGMDKNIGHWRDTHLKIEGPAVQCIQLAYFEDWYWASEKHLYLNWKAQDSEKSKYPVFAFASGPDSDLENYHLVLLHLIHQAKERIWIASPYFVPSQPILYALTLASLKKVDVRILLPNQPDRWVVFLAGFAFINQAQSSPIEFYLYNEGFMHQKTMLFDNSLAMIGTPNLDNRSLKLNFEMSIMVYAEKFTKDVETMLKEDFENATKVERDFFQKKPLWFRFACKAARLFAPIL